MGEAGGGGSTGDGLGGDGRMLSSLRHAMTPLPPHRSVTVAESLPWPGLDPALAPAASVSPHGHSGVGVSREGPNMRILLDMRRLSQLDSPATRRKPEPSVPGSEDVYETLRVGYRQYVEYIPFVTFRGINMHLCLSVYILCTAKRLNDI